MILVQIGLLLSSDKMTPLSWRQLTGKFDFTRCMFTIPVGDDRCISPGAAPLICKAIPIPIYAAVAFLFKRLTV